MRICVAGAYGAFGIKHLDALAAIDGVDVTSVMGPTQAKIDALGWMTLDGGDIALRTPAPLRIGGALSGGSLTLPMTGSLGPILAIDRSLSDAEVASAVTIIADRAAT